MTFNRKAIISTIIISSVVIILVSSWTVFKQRNDQDFLTKSEVAILDQYHSESPEFTDQFTEILEKKNLEADIYENIDVELFKKLPNYGYKWIIFRVHTVNRSLFTVNSVWENYTYFFTTEKYSTSKYKVKQLKGKIRPGKINSSEPIYFTVGPKFVRTVMEGNFDNSIIIIDSCYGSPNLAEALIDKGAKAVANWRHGVNLDHADNGTLLFLKYLMLENSTIGNAAKKVKEEVGPDPIVGGTFTYYPPELENFVPSSSLQMDNT